MDANASILKSTASVSYSIYICCNMHRLQKLRASSNMLRGMYLQPTNQPLLKYPKSTTQISLAYLNLLIQVAHALKQMQPQLEEPCPALSSPPFSICDYEIYSHI